MFLDMYMIVHGYVHHHMFMDTCGLETRIESGRAAGAKSPPAAPQGEQQNRQLKQYTHRIRKPVHTADHICRYLILCIL